jgi:hypothetical protein
MSANDDRDLRERFAALRDEDVSSATPFARLLRGPACVPPVRSVPFVPVAALAAAAAITAVALVAMPRRAGSSIEAAIAQSQSISSWTAPTDTWLTLSGLEIPDSVPSLSPSSVTLPEASTAATATGEAR